MATHFVAVFLVGNNTLTTEYNIFWDLEKFRDFWDLEIFWMATHFVAVFQNFKIFKKYKNNKTPDLGLLLLRKAFAKLLFYLFMLLNLCVR